MIGQLFFKRHCRKLLIVFNMKIIKVILAVRIGKDLYVRNEKPNNITKSVRRELK